MAVLESPIIHYFQWLKFDNHFLHIPEDLIFGAIYIPPENSRFFNNDDLNEFEQEISHYSCNNNFVMLAGDTNSRTGSMKDFVSTDRFTNELFNIDEDIQSDLDKYTILENLSVPLTRYSCDKKTNTHVHRLIQICQNNNIFIVNGRIYNDKESGNFTFRDKSVVDYVLSTAECFRYYSNFEIIETDSLHSDGHSVIAWEFNCKPFQHVLDCDSLQNYKKLKYIWDNNLKEDFVSNLNPGHLNSIFEDFNNSDYCSVDKIDRITSKITSLFQDAAKNTLTLKRNYIHKTKFSNIKSWFGPNCSKARKACHQAKSVYSVNKIGMNKQRLCNASKDYRRTMNFYIKKDRCENAIELRNLSHKDPKKYWQYLKNLDKKPNDKQTPSLNEFFEHFKNINLNDIPSQDIQEDPNLSVGTNEILNAYITEQEIISCLDNLNNGKTPSPSDEITNQYIKSTKSIMVPIYTHLFNLIFESGHIPNAWLEGTIIPLYKNKGSSLDPGNYRPITILSCLGKLFTSVLDRRLTTYLDQYNIIHENQAGFRKHYSTSDHLFTLQALIEILRKKKQKLFCAFIDFSQAFDKSRRAGLLHELLQNNINGNFYRVINNMYQNIKSCISHNGILSNSFLSEIGVLQGENLSPTLFSIYLNDLQSFISSKGSVGVELYTDIDFNLWLKLLVLLYADDTVLISNNEKDLQKSLDTFNEYCKIWHMNVNISKTKVVVFGSRRLNNFRFMLGDKVIEVTDKYHYLGVTFSCNGSFLQARKHVAQQASKALLALYKKSNNSDLPLDLVIKLFDHTVLPILTYGTEIFGFENLDLLEKVHNDFLRHISKARKSTPLYMLMGEFGRYPINIIIKTRIISFWNRLITGKLPNFHT